MAVSAGKSKGFTLVELSIVLVIIGLIAGGILVGRSMIETVRIIRTIRQLDQYEIMVSQFKETYRWYPGKLPSSIAEGYFGSFGDPCIPGKCGGDALADNSQYIGYNNGVEYFMFWKHLQWAGILNDPAHYSGNWTWQNIYVNNDSPDWRGRVLPSSDINKTAIMPDIQESTGVPTKYCSQAFRIAGYNNNPFGGPGYDDWRNPIEGVDNNGGMVPWETALAIDKKIDDGSSISGTVYSVGVSASQFEPYSNYVVAGNPYGGYAMFFCFGRVIPDL